MDWFIVLDGVVFVLGASVAAGAIFWLTWVTISVLDLKYDRDWLRKEYCELHHKVSEIRRELNEEGDLNVARNHDSQS